MVRTRKSIFGSLLLLGAAIASSAFTAPGQDSEAGNVVQGRGVVLFGGSGSNGSLSDTWVWNGKNWHQAFPATHPAARNSASMALDLARNEIVLFGGEDGSTLFSDTWVWNGTNWKQKHPTTVPPARRFAGMAYDKFRQHVVLFGGFDQAAGGNGLADTWVWNGEDWEQKFPTNSPSGRAVLNTMTFDAAINQVVLFGGLEPAAHFADSDTWQWNGDNWEEKFPAASPDNMFGGFGIAYDGLQARVVAFGKSFVTGAVVPVTWLWDGSNWTRVFPAHQPLNSGIIAFDRFDNQLVLVDASSNTSVWNGVDWSTPSPTIKPPARSDFALSSRPRPE